MATLRYSVHAVLDEAKREKKRCKDANVPKRSAVGLWIERL